MAVQRNHDIQIGDIFEYSFSDADGLGTSRSYYQVVALRGKTLVILNAIRAEHFTDGAAARPSVQHPVVYLRPRKDDFYREDGGFLTRFVRGTGRPCLRDAEHRWRYYFRCCESDTGRESGCDAAFDLEHMKKSGAIF